MELLCMSYDLSKAMFQSGVETFRYLKIQDFRALNLNA